MNRNSFFIHPVLPKLSTVVHVLLQVTLVFDYPVAKGIFSRTGAKCRIGRIPFRTLDRFGFGMLVQVAFLGESLGTGKGSESMVKALRILLTNWHDRIGRCICRRCTLNGHRCGLWSDPSSSLPSRTPRLASRVAQGRHTGTSDRRDTRRTELDISQSLLLGPIHFAEHFGCPARGRDRAIVQVPREVRLWQSEQPEFAPTM